MLLEQRVRRDDHFQRNGATLGTDEVDRVPCLAKDFIGIGKFGEVIACVNFGAGIFMHVRHDQQHLACVARGCRLAIGRLADDLPVAGDLFQKKDIHIAHPLLGNVDLGLGGGHLAAHLHLDQSSVASIELPFFLLGKEFGVFRTAHFPFRIVFTVQVKAGGGMEGLVDLALYVEAGAMQIQAHGFPDGIFVLVRGGGGSDGGDA